MSKLSETPSPELSARLAESLRRRTAAGSAELSIDQRRTLLCIAHEAILGGPEPGPSVESRFRGQLSEPRGVFTTLYLEGQLRGCVGFALPIAPLYRAVAESARAAAFDDSRFLPVTEEEAPKLEVSLSVLSRLVPIHPEAVEVGRHGLVVSFGAHRGLLLPQVPVEHDWDRETFLAQTCRKAGLPADAWRRGAIIEAFAAEVFGDRDLVQGLRPT